MNEIRLSKEKGQSLILVAAAMVILVLFVAITVDVSSAYYNRRTAQNGADGAVLAGVSRMATQINDKNMLDSQIHADMNDFAERNGIADTGGDLADVVNDNVDGWYLDADGNRLSGEPMVGDGTVPEGAYGIEAITYIVAPTFFGGIFGLDGLPLDARAVSLLGLVCGADCVVPITTQKDALFEGTEPRTKECFNIYSESEFGAPGSYGWVSWTWQEAMCQDGSRDCPRVEQGNGCNTNILEANLNPIDCASGYIMAEDWVSNSPGIMNSSKKVLCYLDYYLGIPDIKGKCTVSSDVPQPFTIPVYDYTNADLCNNPPTCNNMKDPHEPCSGGLHYHIAGFAKMQILGYRLSQGGKNVFGLIDDPEEFGFDPDFDPLEDCVTLGVPPHDGNRITAQLLQYVTDITQDASCSDPTGTLRAAPKLSE